VHRRPHLSTIRAGAAGVLAAVVVTATSSSCSSGPALGAAPRAADPACAAALKVLPPTVLGRARTPIDVAATASWGEPPVILRCGLPELAPTQLDCMTVDGIDWVVDSRGDPVTITTFGRSPAVEVRIPVSYGPSSAGAAAVDLEAVAAALPTTSRACVG
jgi:hypothetical protein